MSREFTNGPEDQGSIPGQVIPKTQKMVLDTALLNTQHHKVRIKGKVKQSGEWSSALPYTLVMWLLKREPSGHPHLKLPTLLTYVTYIKAKIDNTQQNSKCRSWGDRDKTINHIIDNWSKFAKNGVHDWVGKVIHQELCKRLKFDHADKWFMHKPEFVQENEMLKIV